MTTDRKSELRKEKYTRTQTLLNELSEDGWVFEWDVDDWDQLTAPMFFHVRSVEMLKRCNIA